jgi:hypothetical protein
LGKAIDLGLPVPDAFSSNRVDGTLLGLIPTAKHDEEDEQERSVKLPYVLSLVSMPEYPSVCPSLTSTPIELI